MGEQNDRWNIEERTKDLHLSPSCSSFEVLDPHDPTISRLATHLFRRTNDYLQGEMAAGQILLNLYARSKAIPLILQLFKNLNVNHNTHGLFGLQIVTDGKNVNDKLSEHYLLLEEINRMAITKYADLRNLAANLSKTLNEYNELYQALIKPLLMQIDHIDAQVSQFEANAYRLDSYTKQLRARYMELEEYK